MSLVDAREKLEEWRRDYNEVSPHSAIGNTSPIALMKSIGVTSPPMAKTAQNSTAE
jgi:putative transposase